MFGDYSKDLLRSGIIEVKAGNRGAARRYLDRALYMSSDHDVMAEAWYWMAQASDEAAEKRKALENCLANDLQHSRARREMAVLDGRLEPTEIIDPNAPPVASAGKKPTDAWRYMCARCGGRMMYAPDGRSLICEYCLRHQTLDSARGEGADKDFIVTMATARGHGKPLQEQILHCQGCGAELILPAGQISASCPYCNSPHVLRLETSKDLLAPDGILPHAFDHRHAADLLADWIESLKIEPDRRVDDPRGLYLPVWSFVIGGSIDYSGERASDPSESMRSGTRETVQVRDRYPVILSVSIAASHRPSAAFVRLIRTFDLAAVQAYDPRYLAAWPAELYDVPMAQASLEARSQAYAAIKGDLPTRLAPLHMISTSSANLTIESFRLDLLPVWIAEISFEGRPRLLLINGQTGVVQGEGLKRPKKIGGGVQEWLRDLIAE